MPATDDFLSQLADLLGGGGDLTTPAADPTSTTGLMNGYEADLASSLGDGLSMADLRSLFDGGPSGTGGAVNLGDAIPESYGSAVAREALPSTGPTAPDILSRGVSAAKSAWGDTTGWLEKMLRGDKKALSQAQLGIGALGMLGSLLQSRQSRNQLSPAQLQAMLRSPYSGWTPGQQQSANAYFNQPLPRFTYQPPVGGVQPAGFAKGGQIGCACGGLNALAKGGSPRFVSGSGGGQGDQVPARLSPGEYVMDADTVSALGDGNNAHGAAMLDDMRERIRQQKRSAPVSAIPPKAHHPLAYLRGVR